MKICTNCQHFAAPNSGLSTHEYGRCIAPMGMSQSPVTGEPVPMFVNFAMSMRKLPQQCGEDGAWFEPKQEPKEASA